MKITKGPWKVDKVFGLIVGPKGEEIAAVHSGTADGRQSAETANWNARLLAAAPELLEALQAAWPLLEEHCLGQGPVQEKVYRALLKAEGKP